MKTLNWTVILFLPLKWTILIIAPIAFILYDFAEKLIEKNYFIVDKNNILEKELKDITEKGFTICIGQNYKKISWKDVFIDDLNSKGLELKLYKRNFIIDQSFKNMNELLKNIPNNLISSDIVEKYIEG